MFLRYRPEGSEADTLYEFRPERTDYNRGRVAEKLYAKACGERRTWEQFVVDAKQGSITARKVALWLALTDTHPMTRFDDVPDFRAGELTLEYSKQELRLMRESIKDDTEMLELEKRGVLAQLDREVESAQAGSDEPDAQPDPEIVEPTELGKDDPNLNGEPSTS